MIELDVRMSSAVVLLISTSCIVITNFIVCVKQCSQVKWQLSQENVLLVQPEQFYILITGQTDII